jgi:hypothetical protein
MHKTVVHTGFGRKEEILNKDDRIIWKPILEKLDGGYGLNSPGYEPAADSCEHHTELSDYLRCWGLLDWLSNFWLLKDSAPQN